MSTKNWLGVVVVIAVVAIFGLFVKRTCELTTVAGFVFGGGLLFGGLLIDPAEFREVFRLWRGAPPAP